MKNDLSCPIVRDLLPSYIDGLTAPETNDAVEAHLRSCPDCARLHRQMTAPEESPRQEADREVDYLKQVRRRSRLRVVLAVFCTAALLIGGLAAKIFLIGSPADAAAMAYEVTEMDGGIRVEVISAASANAYWGWRVRQEGDVLRVTCREGLVSALHPTASKALDIPLAPGVTEVRLTDRVIWQDGVAIDRFTLAAWQARTPYVGDPGALGEVARRLRIGELCGGYTTTLHTSGRPYDWCLDFQPGTGESVDPSPDMEHLAPVMLALVDNLDSVSWTWMDGDGAKQRRTVTAEAVSAALPELYAAAGWTAPSSVKDCAESPAALQRLRTALKAAM